MREGLAALCTPKEEADGREGGRGYWIGSSVPMPPSTIVLWALDAGTRTLDLGRGTHFLSSSQAQPAGKTRQQLGAGQRSANLGVRTPGLKCSLSHPLAGGHCRCLPALSLGPHICKMRGLNTPTKIPSALTCGSVHGEAKELR